MSWKFSNAELDDHHNDILGIWKMDEAAGNRADTYGTRTLIDGNTVGSAAGKDNLAADLEAGNTEYFENASEISRAKTVMTMSAWIWLETVGAGDQVIVWEPTASQGYTRFVVLVDASDQLLIAMRDSQSGAAKAQTSVNTFNINTWYHILAMVDTVNNTLQGWVNGVNWINHAVAMNIFSNTAASEEWQVGRSENNVPAWINYFDGKIDELYMWSSADGTGGSAIMDINDAVALYNGGNGRFFHNHPANFFSNG